MTSSLLIPNLEDWGEWLQLSTPDNTTNNKHSSTPSANTSTTTGTTATAAKESEVATVPTSTTAVAASTPFDIIFEQAYTGPPPQSQPQHLLNSNSESQGNAFIAQGDKDSKSKINTTSSSSFFDNSFFNSSQPFSFSIIGRQQPQEPLQVPQPSEDDDNSFEPRAVIDCTKSSASLSTMTRTTSTSTPTSRMCTTTNVFEVDRQPDQHLQENYYPSSPTGTAPTAATNTPNSQNVKNSYKSKSKRSSRGASSSSSTSGLQRAFSKLARCGHSARETSMDLEYLVLSLRQALTAEEAEGCLHKIVTVLKGARSSSGNHNTSSSNAEDSRSSAETKKSMLTTAELQEELVAAGADHCVISTMWTFPSNLAVQYYGIVALGELVAHSNLANQKSIVLKGGIEVILTAMKAHALEETLQEEACHSLKNIMKYYDVAKQQVARHKGISRILQAMMAHPEYASVQRQACYALTSLSCLKPISDDLVAMQGHAVLLKTMYHHNDDPFVLAEAWRTLTNVVIHAMNTSLDEEIACHGGTIELVCQSLNKFADCTVVPLQARGLTLLTHLCYRSASNLRLVTRTQNLEHIQRVLRMWRYDEKIQAAGEKLVQQISQAGYTNNGSTSSVAKSRSSNSRQMSRSSSKQKQQQKVISQIHNDCGMDIILDASLY